MLTRYEADCGKLLNVINQQLGAAGEPVKYKEILVVGIYATPYENWYRVVVLEKVWPDYSIMFLGCE